MKKKIAAILTIALALGSLTACNTNAPANSSDNSSSSDIGSSSDSSSSSDTDSSSDSDPVEETVIGVYGVTEIPDIPCGSMDDEGKAVMHLDEVQEALEQSLDCMIFETHTVGDYTISLVGDSVRTDKTNFSGSIYTQNLRVEVEKNGTELEDSADYNEVVLYFSQFTREYILFEDRIGSYVDLYELDSPVIAMRYFFDNESAEDITKAVEFSIIIDDVVYSDLTGNYDEGLGVMDNPNPSSSDYKTSIMLNDYETTCRVGIFAADEFEVLDGTTLVDDEAGITYSFDFSSYPPQITVTNK